MRILGAFIVLSLAAFGTAQSVVSHHPVYLEVGAYFPNYRGGNFGHDVGAAAGLGYSFFEKGDFSVSAEVRGAYHFVLGAGGGDSFDSPSGPADNTLTLSSWGIGVRHRHHGTNLFTGLGIASGRAGIDDHGSKTATVFSAEVGYYFNPKFYVVVRYQTADEDALRGATLGLGFRF